MSMLPGPPEDAPTERCPPSDQPTLTGAQLGDGGGLGDFGGFRILRQLGSGGMGQVFLAEQNVPMTRRVALKLIRAALITPELAARFAIEQQALARLEHPAIARLYEAGTAQGGFPWFAMEWVDGAPLTEYADSRQLSIAQRLTLFTRVCEGVRHAHRRGILHRDLKPSNILVAEIDGIAHPKIIDFGIAKALDTPDGGGSLTGADVIGTPAYLAPEALGIGDGQGDLDTRVDVYALGVILYELLAGARPHQLSGTSLMQMIREVAESEAPTPLQRFRALPAPERTQAAQLRGLPEPALERVLAGELGWIATHAVARQRDERYGSVDALLGDLERHGRNEPLSVAPPSAWYRLKKLLRRRRGPAMAIAAVFVSLVGGIIAFSLAAERADREATAAQQARLEAEQVVGFLTSLFEQADPSRSRGNTLTAREVLDSGAQRIRSELSEQPQLRGALLRTLGSVYESMGLYPQAQPLLEEAQQQARSTREQALALTVLARLRAQQGQYAQASAMFGQALQQADQEAILSHSELAGMLNRYGTNERLLGRMEHAAALHFRELALRIADYGPSNTATAPAYYALAYIAYDRRDYRSAELLLERTIAIYQSADGPDHRSLAGPLRALADVYDDQGRRAEAEPLYLRSLAITETVYGPDHPNVALQANNLGVSYYLQDRLDEALVFLTRSLQINEKRLPADHPELGNPNLNLGLVYLKRGDYAAAEARFRHTLALWKGRIPDDDPNLAWAWWGLGSVCMNTDRNTEALEWLGKAVALRAAKLPADHPDLAAARATLEQAQRMAEANPP
jgi:eukaryotic-like serine/threonine-protein kinase